MQDKMYNCSFRFAISTKILYTHIIVYSVRRNHMANSIISVIFLIILSFISIFEVRTYMQYVFEKSLAETATTQVIEKHAVFSEILYVYPWKYIKRYRFIFLLFQIMYFSCITSTILVVKTILLNYLQNRDFWKAMRYNNIAISALPMMLCILIAPIIYFILRQCWGKGRVEIDRMALITAEVIPEPAF